jgi:hypothetical protein
MRTGISFLSGFSLFHSAEGRMDLRNSPTILSSFCYSSLTVDSCVEGICNVKRSCEPFDQLFARKAWNN